MSLLRNVRVSVQENSVVKNMHNACLQSAYCKLLGDGVCPRILREYPNYYEMEKLYNTNKVDQLEVLSFLAYTTWSRDVPVGLVKDWQRHLSNWLHFHHRPQLIKVQERLYSKENKVKETEYVFIHGNPLSSNVKRNTQGELRIISPIKPSRGVPFLREVDLGKMLQSYVGWDDTLHYGRNMNFRPLYKKGVPFLETESSLMRKRAKFWMCIHFLDDYEKAVNEGRLDVARIVNAALPAIISLSI